MAIVAAPATPGKWVDTNVPLTSAVIAALVAEGYKGVFRYGPLPGVSAHDDLTHDELVRACAGGLEVGAIQHARFPGWDPAGHSGASDAIHVAQYLQGEGFPFGAHVGQDVEGCAPSATAETCTAFLQDWQASLRFLRFRAMLYHGYGVPLDAEELYYQAGYDCYFRAPGQVKVAVRGDAVVQGGSVVIAAVRFDIDIVEADALGGLPWVATLGA